MSTCRTVVVGTDGPETSSRPVERAGAPAGATRDVLVVRTAG